LQRVSIRGAGIVGIGLAGYIPRMTTRFLREVRKPCSDVSAVCFVNMPERVKTRA
jgi:hypothetical protein